MYKIKVISNVFGIDDHSPIFMTLDDARRIGQRMLLIHHEKVRVEIYQVLDLHTHSRRLVDTLETPDKPKMAEENAESKY
jgi:hypothetical protein